MFELKTSALASRGRNLGKDVLQIQPLVFDQLMSISESIETDDYLPFVLAIQDSCNSDLDLCDFYLVAAIQRIISMPDMPIMLNWECRENNAEIQILTSDKATEISEILTSLGFVYSDEKSRWIKNSVSKAEYAKLNKLLDQYVTDIKGSWFTCLTKNSEPLTPEHLLNFVRQFPEDMVLDPNFATPKAIDIADYNELAKNPRMKKLLPVVLWMSDRFGSTLKARMRFLTEQPREVTFPIVQKALKYDTDYRAGLAKVINCPPCSCCGARTEPFTLTIGPKIFFVGG